MAYPNDNKLFLYGHRIYEYARLMNEYGADGIDQILNDTEVYLKSVEEKIENLKIDSEKRECEPNDLKTIKKLRPEGVRRIWNSLDEDTYEDKLEGALMARMAGCILGAPVEGWPVAELEEWAQYCGMTYPPGNYWEKVKCPTAIRYGKSRTDEYTRSQMNGVPADDDIAYTLIGLLIAEKWGLDFTTADVGQAWLKYIPMACTAEEIALENLKKGISAEMAGELNNPYCQWIGADIRSDPWAYIAPGLPEQAAEFAYRDAFLSHRRNGIYGEMFFAAAQSAAFTTDNAMDALRIGLEEIPENCDLAKDIQWALHESSNICNYKDARMAVDERFNGMSEVHTQNNACLTVFGLLIGGNNVTKVLSETVAMGMDNDCTAATAGSIVGAIVGKNGVPLFWTAPFKNRITTYLTGEEEFAVDDVIKRFKQLAIKLFGRR